MKSWSDFWVAAVGFFCVVSGGIVLTVGVLIAHDKWRESVYWQGRRDGRYDGERDAEKKFQADAYEQGFAEYVVVAKDGRTEWRWKKPTLLNVAMDYLPKDFHDEPTQVVRSLFVSEGRSRTRSR